jgi:hypothetical protein
MARKRATSGSKTMKPGRSRAATATRGKRKIMIKRKPATPHDALDDFIEAAARLLELPIEPSWRPAIRMNLDVILRQGALFEALALPDEAEPAPVFRA